MSSLCFVNSRAESPVFVEDFEFPERFGKLHRKIDLPTARPPIDSASSQNGVIILGFQLRGQNRVGRIAKSMDKIEDEVAAVVERERVFVNSCALRGAQFSPDRVAARLVKLSSGE